MSTDKFTKVAVGAIAVAAIRSSIESGRQTKQQAQILELEQMRAFGEERQRLLRKTLFAHQQLADNLDSFPAKQALYWCLYTQAQAAMADILPDSFDQLADKEAAASLHQQFNQFQADCVEEINDPAACKELEWACELTLRLPALQRRRLLLEFQQTLPTKTAYYFREAIVVVVCSLAVGVALTLLFRDMGVFVGATFLALIGCGAWKDFVLSRIKLGYYRQAEEFAQRFGFTITPLTCQIDVQPLVSDAQKMCQFFGLEPKTDPGACRSEIEQIEKEYAALAAKYGLEDPEESERSSGCRE